MVNDPTIFRKEQNLRKLYDNFDSLFELNVLGNAQYLLGIEITCGKKGEVLLNQEGFVNTLLQAHRMELCVLLHTPLDIRAVTVLTVCPEKQVLDDTEITAYQILIESIHYSSMVIRPNIAYVADLLEGFGTRCTVTHLTVVKHVLRYHQYTKTMKVRLSGSVQSKVEPQFYANADYASDILDGKSTSGIGIFVFASLVYWKNKKQSLVAQSTADAEFVASAYALLEAEGVKRVLKGLDNNATKVISKLFNDNQSAIQNMEAGSNYRASRHYDCVRYYWLKYAIVKGEITVGYCLTDNMLADVFTKYLLQIKQEVIQACLDMGMFE